MKKISSRFSYIALLLASSIYSGALFAETKIAYVDAAKLMESAPQAKSAQSKIEKEFAPRDKEMVTLQRQIKTKEDKLIRDGAVMSESERSKLERDILSKRRDLKRTTEEFRDDLNIRKNELLVKLQKDIYEAIVMLAKEQKFDLVLTQGVVYASDKIDITASVLKKLTGK